MSATNATSTITSRCSQRNGHRGSTNGARKTRAAATRTPNTLQICHGAPERIRSDAKLVRLKEELVRLQALTDETRARLSAFLTDGLRVLNADIETGRANDPEPALERLDDTLHRQLPSTLFAHGQLPSTSAAEPVPREQAETQAEH